jgi:hypothetical protein
MCLLPNSTHILQPADGVGFWTLERKKWRCLVQSAHVNQKTRKDFALLFIEAMRCIEPSIVTNGFRACDLFPFNPDSVDYTKCVSVAPPDLNTMQEATAGGNTVLGFEKNRLE